VVVGWGEYRSFGVGTCNGFSATTKRVGSVFQTAIRLPISGGIPKTTHYLYTALMDGTFPWTAAFTGQGNLPRSGDMLGNNRVLDTDLVAGTFTFR
jgi:hypothetical protein